MKLPYTEAIIQRNVANSNMAKVVCYTEATFIFIIIIYYLIGSLKVSLLGPFCTSNYIYIHGKQIILTNHHTLVLQRLTFQRNLNISPVPSFFFTHISPPICEVFVYLFQFILCKIDFSPSLTLQVPLPLFLELQKCLGKMQLVWMLDQ